MKKLMKICSMILCITIISVLSACSGGGTNATSSTSTAKEGVTFSFSKDALVSAKTTNKSLYATVPITLDPTARYVKITITGANGTTDYLTDIYTLNGSYISATIPLTPGNYSVTQFLVLDSNSHVLYLVPTQTAADDLKRLVSPVLPVSVTVAKDVANTVTLQVLAPDNSTPLDFGYPSGAFSIVNYVRFMSCVQTLDSTTKNWQLIDTNLTVNGVNYIHPAQTSTLRVAQADSYTLVFSKIAYDTKTIILTAADIANYQSAPLVVTLTPTVYHTVTFNSNGGLAVPPQKIADGGVASRPVNPSKTGYTFIEWYSDAGLTSPFNFSTPITADITLYAKWTPIQTAMVAKTAKTGQTGCWDANGIQVACAGTGQDGDILTGLAWPAARFTDNSIASAAALTVTDNLTGLIWTKDANLAGTINWQQALDYIKSLNNSNYLGHNDWRLPNVNELGSFANYQQLNQATWLNTQGFVNVQINWYWSSTTHNDNLNCAWVGSGGSFIALDKTSNNCVWPVRGGQSGTLILPKTGQTRCWDANGDEVACTGTGQDGELQSGATWPNAHFTDNTDLTMTDILTGLTWPKDAYFGVVKSWPQALDYIKNLNSSWYLGHNDWRMPNVNELRSLANSKQPSLTYWLSTQGFAHFNGDFYWSSTTNVNTTYIAWGVYMVDGSVSTKSKINGLGYSLWPVRGGQ